VGGAAKFTGLSPPLSIADGVDLGRAPATRPANCLSRSPPFPPAADRCALTCEESIKSSSGLPAATTNAAKIRVQIPRWLHRL
jgi:hypothetical protein